MADQKAIIRDRILERLWTDDASEISVYAILDAARDEQVYRLIQSSRLPWVCLYSGNLPISLAKAAPYLLKLEKKHSTTNTILDRGWGQSWGVFLRSAAELNQLRKHFHSFLMVEDEGGRRLVFRYYDPRVFRVYLPTCRPNELQTVFGPVKQFFVEAEEPTCLLEFRLNQERLITEQHAFDPLSDADNLTP